MTRSLVILAPAGILAVAWGLGTDRAPLAVLGVLALMVGAGAWAARGIDEAEPVGPTPDPNLPGPAVSLYEPQPGWEGLRDLARRPTAEDFANPN